MGLPASYRVSRVRYYSGTTPVSSAFRLREFHPLCQYVPVSSTRLPSPFARPATPNAEAFGLGSSPFARRYLENRSFFLFLRVLRCFSSPRFLLYAYRFSIGYRSITSGGFPHSDICGSTDICSSPQLFAACHVLLRLPVPRHPPYALSCLTFVNSLCEFAFSLSGFSVQNRSSRLHSLFQDLAFVRCFSISRSLCVFLTLLRSLFSFQGTAKLCLANRFRSSLRASWWAWEDSNLRPHAYQACALTT